MNAQILQNLKNKLETRYQNVRSSDHNNFIVNLKNFYEILEKDKVFISVLKELEIEISQSVKDMFIRNIQHGISKFGIASFYRKEKNLIECGFLLFQEIIQNNPLLINNDRINGTNLFLARIFFPNNNYFIRNNEIFEYIKKLTMNLPLRFTILS